MSYTVKVKKKGTDILINSKTTETKVGAVAAKLSFINKYGVANYEIEIENNSSRFQ